MNFDIEIVNENYMVQLIGERTRKNVENAHEEYIIQGSRLRIPGGQEVYHRYFSQSNFARGYNAKFLRKFIKCRARAKKRHARYELKDLTGNLIGTYHAKDIHQ